jgi:hypothetical protein
VKKVAGVTIAGAVGAVGYFLSLGFMLPPGAEGFKFFATFAVISGFAVGSIVAKRAKSYSSLKVGSFVIVNLAVGFSTAVGYMLLMATGANAGIALFILLACFLTVTFFCLGFILSLAGVSLSHEIFSGP